MTEAYFCEWDDEAEIEITGHAGFNPGNDIVCASCSILTFTLLQTIKEMEIDNDVTINEERDEDGYFFLRFKYVPGVKSEIETVLRVIENGFALLEEHYPDNVHLLA